MADKPILFSGAMVRALLAGTKTQTRRLCVLPEPSAPIIDMVKVATDAKTGRAIYEMRDAAGRHVTIREGKHFVTSNFSPRIAVGDRLYVREAWHAARSLNGTPPRDIPRDADIEHAATARSYAEIGLKGKLRPAMFMPRWASRLTLTVTDIRVERLQDISENHALAEGILWQNAVVGSHGATGTHVELTADRYWNLTEPEDFEGHDSAVDAYADLWDHINGTGPWDANPWVAAYTFTVHHTNIDQLEAA